MHSADKSSPTISIQSFLEKVKDIDEFVKRIPIEKILESNDNSKKSKDDTIDEDYLAAVERGDTEAAQRMVDVFLNICFNNLRQYRTIHMCGIALSQIILLKNTFVI